MECENGSLIDPVRCVGNYNANNQPAFPRSHHKFILFCRYREHCQCQECLFLHDMSHCDYCSDRAYGNRHIEPYAVWTGSFNFTKSATASFENAVVLQDEKIVQAFYAEYGQIAAISEPLDWTSAWMAPEWTHTLPY